MSDSESSRDDEVMAEAAAPVDVAALRQQLARDPTNYDLHAKLVTHLTAYDELVAAREAMAKQFPLTEGTYSG